MNTISDLFIKKIEFKFVLFSSPQSLSYFKAYVDMKHEFEESIATLSDQIQLLDAVHQMNEERLGQDHRMFSRFLNLQNNFTNSFLFFYKVEVFY